MSSSIVPANPPVPGKRGRLNRSVLVCTVSVALLSTACVTTKEQQGQVGGGVLGAGVGAMLGSALGQGRSSGSRDRIVAASVVAGATLGVVMGGVIGRQLDQADQQRAAEAAQRAAAERQAAIDREMARRDRELARQREADLQRELARARTDAERARAAAEAERQANARRQQAEREVASSVQAQPVAWNGNARGQAQAVETVAVSGQQCQKVREVAIVQGKELSQDATLCRQPNGSWQRVTA